MNTNSISLLLMAITIYFTILLSNNIHFLSSYGQNITTAKTTTTTTNKQTILIFLVSLLTK